MQTPVHRFYSLCFGFFKAEILMPSLSMRFTNEPFDWFSAKILIVSNDIANRIVCSVSFMSLLLSSFWCIVRLSSRLKHWSKRTKGDFVSPPCSHHCLCHFMSLAASEPSPRRHFHYIWLPFSVSQTDFSGYVSIGWRLSNCETESEETMCSYSNNIMPVAVE